MILAKKKKHWGKTIKGVPKKLPLLVIFEDHLSTFTILLIQAVICTEQLQSSCLSRAVPAVNTDPYVQLTIATHVS